MVVAIFDSGLGGLPVYEAIKSHLPDLGLVYLGIIKMYLTACGMPMTSFIVQRMGFKFYLINQVVIWLFWLATRPLQSH